MSFKERYRQIVADRPFQDDRKGSVGIIFGLSFIPAVMVMGVAVDYRNAATMKSRLQGAVDMASLAVVKQSDANLTDAAKQALAQNVVNAKLGPSASIINVSVAASSSEAGGVEISATASVPTTVLKFARFDSITVAAKATALEGEMTVSSGGAGCVLSLNESAVEALDWSGNADVLLKNCDIYGNSGASNALDVGGSSKLKVQKVSVHGNISVQGSGVLDAQTKLTGQPRMQDPYESVLLPAFGECEHNSFSTNDGGELNPGVYCNGLSINTNSKNKGELKLNPGLYVIDGGQLFINGQAKVVGEGVTIVFTKRNGSGWANARINGGAEIDLEAPKKDATNGVPGVLFYGDRAMAVGTEFKLNGGSTQELKGAVYLPEAKLTFNGGASTTGLCMQLIADTVTFTGNANVGIEGCGDFGIKSFGSSTTRTVRVAK